MHGVTPVWASEIEPYPIRVTKARFPQMKHLGSVLDVNGAEIEPVDIITFGSPCQDLSVAGKQAGLHKGERSNLFFEAIRIIKEMRESTDGKYPRIAVWENVPGAYSSNKGEDFRAVLKAFAQINDEAADVPGSPTGKWNRAGAIVGNGWSIAWRTFDAQFWGVPQRRKRIYLIADFGSERAGEVLFEQEGVRRHSAPGGTAREGTSDNAEGSAGGSGGVRCLNPWDYQTIRQYDASGVYPALPSNETGGQNRQGVVYPNVAGSLIARHDGSPCVDRGQPFVCFHCQQDPIPNDKHSPCIGGQGQATVGVCAAFMGGQGVKAGGIGYQEEVSPTLKASPSGGNTVPDVVYALQGNGIDRADTAGCNGKGWREDQMYTLNTIDRPALCFANRPFNAGDTSDVVKTLCATEASKQPGITVVYDARGNGDGEKAATITGDYESRVTDYSNIVSYPAIAETLDASYYKGTGARNGKERTVVVEESKLPRKYIVRRLTPLECCRLQGFPDWWEDGVQGSDSARYKMWGNGIALPNAAHVIGCAKKLIQGRQP
jgi:DNA (cytosine-5)-methyltransferase 1